MRPWVISSLVGACALAGAPATTRAQTTAGTGAGALTIVPTASASEMFTDNYNLGYGNPTADAITRLSGGLRMNGKTRRFDGFLTYDLIGIVYARHSEENQTQHELRAQIKSELIDNHGFLDASASISRQAISAFGVQSGDPALINANTTEVRSLRVMPSLRGQLPGLWDYDASLELAASRTGDGGLGDSNAGRASLQFNRSQQGRLSWSLLMQQATLRYTNTRDTNDKRIVATAFYDMPEADLKFSASAGYERSNVTTVDSQADVTLGAGVIWAPSPRTRLDASYDHRQFGRTHSINFEYRSARTVWHFSSSQQVSQIAAGSGTTFFNLYYTQFASVEPDPAKRTQLVNDFLQRNGISSNGTVPGSALPQSTTITNQQTLSFALQGVRSGVTVSASVSDQWQADPLAQVPGDFADGQHVYSQGLSANFSHRLTPQSTLNLVGTLSDSQGSLQSSGDTRLKSLSLVWSNTLSRYVTVSATLRHSSFDSVTNPYRENAAIAALNAQF